MTKINDLNQGELKELFNDLLQNVEVNTFLGFLEEFT